MFNSRAKTGFALLFIIVLQTLSLPDRIKCQNNETFFNQINDDVLIGLTAEAIFGMPARIYDCRGFPLSLFRYKQGSSYIVPGNGFKNDLFDAVILFPDYTCNTGI